MQIYIKTKLVLISTKDFEEQDMYTNWKICVKLQWNSTMSRYDIETNKYTSIDVVLTRKGSVGMSSAHKNLLYELIQRRLRYNTNLKRPFMKGREGGQTILEQQLCCASNCSIQEHQSI